MQPISRLLSMAAVAGLAVGMAGCSPDKDAIVEPTGGGNNPTFANVSAALVSSCGGCHKVGSGRTFIATMDSATLLGSGLVNPASPSASALLIKPRSASHGGGIVSTFTTIDSALVAAWIAKAPAVDVTTLNAVKTEFAPMIDGAGDALWFQATPLTIPIAGGWAAAKEISVRAMYDEGYLYMLLKWKDNQASYRRQPWVKNADGTWAVSAAKPAPENGVDDWQTYIAKRGGAAFNNEGPDY
ncbi:MAG: hypothetical protein ABIQ16_21010, partial [Polyangiaceae bacterium]